MQSELPSAESIAKGAWFLKMGAMTGQKKRFMVLDGRAIKYYKRVDGKGVPQEQKGQVNERKTKKKRKEKKKKKTRKRKKEGGGGKNKKTEDQGKKAQP